MDRRVRLARQLAVAGLIGLASLGLRFAVDDSGESGELNSRTADVCPPPSVGFVVDYVPRLRAFAVTGAELADISAECGGRTVQLTFVADDGSYLAEASALLTPPRARVDLPASSAVVGERVASVSVAVLS